MELKIAGEASALVGRHAARLAQPPRRGRRRRGRREARVLQPRRVGQGPARGGDDRRRRARRADRAGLGDRRAHVGQHRNRAGTRRGGARLQADPDPARGHEPGAIGAPSHLRSRGPRDALDGRDERSGRAGAEAGLEARRVHADAVLESRQRRDPPPDHRGGDLVRPRRRGRCVRRRGRDRGHDHGRRPGAEGAPTRRAGDRRRACILARALRRQAGAAPHPGDRRRASSPRSSTAT